MSITVYEWDSFLFLLLVHFPLYVPHLFRDNSLNINEFTALLKALFRNEKGKPYPIDNYMANELFMIFNQSGDGSMSKQEFAFCWNNWIKRVRVVDHSCHSVQCKILCNN